MKGYAALIILISFALVLTGCRFADSGLRGSLGVEPSENILIQFESTGDGSGLVFTNVDIVQGQEISLFAVERTPENVFISSVSVQWSVQNTVGTITTSSVGPNILFRAEQVGAGSIDVNYNGKVYSLSVSVAPGPGVVSTALQSYNFLENESYAVVYLERNFGSMGAISASYSLTQGTAISALDYTDVSGTVNWADGESVAKPILIPVLQDSDWEVPDEKFTLTIVGSEVLNSPVNIDITLLDDGDANTGTIGLDAAEASVLESAPSISLNVNRIGGTDTDITISYAITPETASEGLDYTAVSGSLTWLQGDASTQSITIPILQDALAEAPDETFLVELSGNAVGSISSTRVTILNDGDFPPVNLTVASLYPGNGAQWNDYVNNDGADKYHATDVTCNGSSPGFGYEKCIHGGEVKVVTTGLADCTGAAMVDELGVFDWVCDDQSGLPVRFYSVGVKKGKGLKNLLNASSWKNNRVILSVNGIGLESSVATTWWTNPVTPLPDNSLATDVTIDLSSSGTIYTGDTSRATRGYRITADKIGFVTLPSVQMSWVGDQTPVCSLIVCNSGGVKYLWVELNSRDKGVNLQSVSYSRFHQMTTTLGVNTYSQRYSVVTNSKLTEIDISNQIVANRSLMVTWNSNLIFEDVNLRNGPSGAQAYGIHLQDNNPIKMTNISLDNFQNSGIVVIRSELLELYNTSVTNINGSQCVGIQDNSYDIIIDNFECLNSTTGIIYFLTGSHRTIMNNIRISNTSSEGIYVQGADDVKINNVRTQNTGSYGIYFASTAPRATVAGAMLSGANYGLYSNSADSLTSQVLASNNSIAGIYLTAGASRSTLSHVTAGNNTSRGVYIAASDVLVNNILAANNNDGIYIVGNSSVFSNLSVDNETSDLQLSSADNSKFTNNLLVSDVGCIVSGGTAPGLVDSNCGQQDASDHNLIADISLMNSFVGKATEDFSNTTSSFGTQEFPSIVSQFDWTLFDNQFRHWGVNGSPFMSADNRGICAGGTCRIWDWSLLSSDLFLLNKSFAGNTVSQSFVSGVTCPNSVDGSVVIVDENTAPNTFLLHAFEILDDGAGNDNGLCESGEDCIYAPNFGVYQGHGDYMSNGTCLFSDGTVTGVNLYSYPSNGY